MSFFRIVGVFLHDPRLKSTLTDKKAKPINWKGVKSSASAAGAAKSGTAVKDTFFWPDMEVRLKR